MLQLVSQNSGVVPKTFASKKAVSAVTPRRPPHSSLTVFRPTPIAFASSPWVTFHRESNNHPTTDPCTASHLQNCALSSLAGKSGEVVFYCVLLIIYRIRNSKKDEQQ
nr:hypothetical protein [Photorhabdus thracensis]